MEADSNEEESATTETHGEVLPLCKLIKPRYYKSRIRIVRKNHLTINQFKPVDDTSEFSITCLPYTCFDFWGINAAGTHFQEPYSSLGPIFPLSEDPGLLGCTNVQTLSSGQTYHKTWKFENHPRLFHRTPQWNTDYHQYLPFDLFRSGLIGPEISAAKTWVNSYNNVRAEGGGSLWLADTCGQMCSPDITANPIFLFLPYIEPVSTSENATRMMAHVLMQTSIDLTVYSPTYGWQNYYKQNSTTEPEDPFNMFMQQQTLVPENHSINDATLRFSNFVQ
ncbi:unnamed protein product [Schistosoma margrebowiei]|uniref:Uncharacterized protein n=1 Tax=Schistosoma margrebowiei TaxID=48269 RepID=A0A183N3Z1_9TREM|nr:unnamed protein product [Schistosoma margrebowiei]